MDLAKVETPSRALPQKTFRRETTMPRQDTDQPKKEVNARIIGSNSAGDNAEALAKLLGVAADTASNVFQERQREQDAQNAGQAALDFESGTKDEDRFAKSRAYRDAWQVEGAKNLSLTIGAEVQQAVNERLNDSDHPATLEEINGLVEDIFQKHVMGSDGKPMDFGPAKAKVILANALQEVKSSIIPNAAAAIKKQTDAKFLTTWANNSVHEFYRNGAEIGAPVTVSVLDKQPVVEHLPGGLEELTPHQAVTQGNVGGVPSILATSAPKVSGPIRATKSAVEAAVIHFESGGDPNAISAKGAKGLMQTMPFTLKAPGFGVKPAQNDSPEEMARVGRDYLQAMTRRYGSLPVALAAYNAGPGAVDDWLHGTNKTGKNPRHIQLPNPHKGGGTEAQFWAGIPFAETKTYVANITARLGQPISAGLGNAPPLVLTGDEPALVTQAPDPTGDVHLAPFNFERAMANVPPGISKGDAKAFLIQSLFNEANARGDIGLLQGLEESKKADGTPSFTPEEVAKIAAARDVISEKARAKADREEKRMQSENADRLLTASLGDTPPSDAFIRDAAEKRLIDPNFAFTLINHNKSERDAAEREAKNDQRIAIAETNAELDDMIAGMVAERSVGHLDGSSAAEDTALLHSGRLGEGKRALARYQRLRAAVKAGEQQNLQNPDYAVYLGELKEKYGTKPTNLIEKRLTGNVNYTGMAAFYQRQVAEGKAPVEAYQETILKFAPKNSPDAAAARDARIKQLMAKRLGSGR